MGKLFSIENRKAIIISVISTIICIYFVEPVISFLGNLGLYIVKAISDTLYNRLFEEIALGKPDYAFTLVVSMFALLTTPILFVAIGLWTRKRRSEDNVDLDVATEEAVESPREQQTIEKGRNRFLLLRLLLVIVFLLGLGQMILGDIKIKTIQTFEQRIRILTPYMTQDEKDRIISDFARMKTFGDFDKIDKRLNQIADTSKIELPKTRNHIF
jgi:hypothetical protein